MREENFGNTIENLVTSQLKINGDPKHLCLVATKSLSFGVGGGVSELLPAHETTKTSVEMVLEKKCWKEGHVDLVDVIRMYREIYPRSRTQVLHTQLKKREW
jgi:hypothetical protein